MVWSLHKAFTLLRRYFTCCKIPGISSQVFARYEGGHLLSGDAVTAGSSAFT